MSGKTTGLSLYQQAVIFDIEATSLTRDSSILEGSFLRVRDQNLVEFHLAPNLTRVELGRIDRDASQLRSHPADSVRNVNTLSHKESLVKQLLIKEAQLGITNPKNSVDFLMDPTNQKALMKRMKRALPYQYSTISGGKFERVSKEFGITPGRGRAEEVGIRQELADIKSRLKAQGRYTLVENATMEQFLNEGLATHAKQNAIWIANVNYEGKQLGAKLAAHEADYRRSLVFKALGEDQARKRFAAEGLDQKELDRLAGLSRKSKAELQEMLFQTNKNMTPAKLANLEMNLRGSLSQTNLNTTDLFSVTGKQVNEAIALSRIDNDWRRVYEAYITNTKAGDVRDIMDVIRAQLSYSREFGLIKTNQINNLSMDMAYRMYGASIASTPEEAIKYLKTPELHTSAGDVAITENLVLRSSLEQTQALYELEKNPAQARKILEGFNFSENTNLMKALRFATLMDGAQEIEQLNIEKRLYRALDDIIATGESSQATNIFKMRTTERAEVKVDPMTGRRTLSNTQMNVAQVARYETYNNLDDVYDHIKKFGQYSTENVEAAIANFESRIGDQNNRLKRLAHDSAKGKLGAQERLAARGTLRTVEDGFDRTAKEIFDKIAVSINTKGLNVYDGVEELRRSVGRNKVARNFKALDVSDARVLKYAGLYGGIIMSTVGLIGLASDSVFGNSGQRLGDANLRTMNYHRWLEANQEYAGLYDPTKDQDGMTHVGLGALLRKANTDFGSPYEGPTYSSFVFENQKLLQERERYTRELFSKRHFSFDGDVGAYLLGASPVRVRHRIDISGQEVDTSAFAGLKRGQRAVKLDLSKYNVQVEDADTIVLKRAGMGGFLSRMFGLNDTGSVIRLAGIDAPETAHAGRQAMAYAEMSKGALQAMLSGGSSLEVLVDPNNVTYGRLVGSVFVDGQNVATSLLKRGLAAHLPFNKKGQTSMQMDMIYSQYQSLAQGMDYNMWGSAQYKVYEDFVKKSGKTITFNTLVNPEKVAKNGTQLSIASLMSSAEQMGFYSNLMQSEVASIAEVAKDQNMRPDWSTPILNRNVAQKTHKNYINHLVNDVNRFMTERETGIQNKNSARLQGSMNKSLVLDGLGTTNSIYTQERYKSYDLYNVNAPKRRYKRRMAEMQRKANREFNTSPIGHWRM